MLMGKWGIYVMLAGGQQLLSKTSHPRQQAVKVLVKMMYLDFLHHFVIRRTKYLGVSITKETARSVLLAAASCIHAGFAMTKAVTIRWIGNFVACMHIHYRVLASRSVDSCFNFCL